MKIRFAHIWNSNKKHRSLILTVSALFLFLITGTIYFFSQDNLIGGIAMFVLPFPFFYLYKVFANPRLGFISVLYANYFAIGLSRYVSAPTGLLVDAFCFLTMLSVIFSQFNHKIEWKNASKDFTVFAIIWFIMTLLQLVNPETINRKNERILEEDLRNKDKHSHQFSFLNGEKHEPNGKKECGENVVKEIRKKEENRVGMEIELKGRERRNEIGGEEKKAHMKVFQNDVMNFMMNLQV